MLESFDYTGNHTDGELVMRCRDGDHQAWIALLRRYGGLVYSIAWKCHLPPEDVADVFQSVFVTLLDNLNRLPEDSNLGSWLTTVTLQQCQRLADLYQQLEEELSNLPGDSLWSEEMSRIWDLIDEHSAGQTDSTGSPLTDARRAGRDPAPLETTFATTASWPIFEPPEWLTQQARSLYSWHQAGARRSDRLRIPAFLLIDSFAEGCLPGFRSVGMLSRQMLYRAGSYNINLSINYIEQNRALDLMGQPMPLDADLTTVAGAEVELLKESVIAHATKANEFGAFILDGLQQGTYDLRIVLEDEEIEIVGLDVHTHPGWRRT